MTKNTTSSKNTLRSIVLWSSVLVWSLIFCYKQNKQAIMDVLWASSMVVDAHKHLSSSLDNPTELSIVVSNLEFYHQTSKESIWWPWYMIWDMECDLVINYYDVERFYLLEDIAFDITIISPEDVTINIDYGNIIQRTNYNNKRQRADAQIDSVHEVLDGESDHIKQAEMIDRVVETREKQVIFPPSDKLIQQIQQELHKKLWTDKITIISSSRKQVSLDSYEIIEWSLDTMQQWDAALTDLGEKLYEKIYEAIGQTISTTIIQ